MTKTWTCYSIFIGYFLTTLHVHAYVSMSVTTQVLPISLCNYAIVTELAVIALYNNLPSDLCDMSSYNAFKKRLNTVFL